MHDPKTVLVKQRVELGPQWAKAAGLYLDELSVSTDEVDHEPADRHLHPVTRRRQHRLDCGVQRAFAEHADSSTRASLFGLTPENCHEPLDPAAFVLGQRTGRLYEQRHRGSGRAPMR